MIGCYITIILGYYYIINITILIVIMIGYNNNTIITVLMGMLGCS